MQKIDLESIESIDLKDLLDAVFLHKEQSKFARDVLPCMQCKVWPKSARWNSSTLSWAQSSFSDNSS